jgi:hypothetical protein
MNQSDSRQTTDVDASASADCYFELSLNDTVSVKLTDHGKGALHAKHVLGGNPRHWMPPQQDKDGYSDWLLWDLMAHFGLYMRGGCMPMWDGSIRVSK